MTNGPYAYTPAIWPTVLTALFLLALAAYGWRHRYVPGAKPFAISCLFTTAWAIGFVLEYTALTEATKSFWLRFGAMWSLPAITAVTCFILEYTWPDRWLTRRNLILLSVVPLLFALLLLTEESHHILMRGYTAYGGRMIAQMNWGLWFFLGYSYLLGAVNIGVLIWLFAHSPPQRWPAALMIIGQIANRLIFTMQIVRPDEYGLPLNLPFLLLPYLVYAVALFAFRILDPVALARQTAIERLGAGLVVIDQAGQIMALNPAAERILGLPAGGYARGRRAAELLPAEALSCCYEHGETEHILRLGDPPERDYLLKAFPLQDWRGLGIGHLFLFHDVTEQQRTQTQLLDQQRVLATLQERERLARELHDGVGQILSYVSLQAQAIQKHVHDGNPAAAEAQLARLAEMAAAAHLDVRESILSLKAGHAPPRFLTDLDRYLAACGTYYGLATELNIDDGLSDDDFAPDTAVQLLRVIAEAMTNARKHGHAGRVRVTLSRKAGDIHIAIEDDGRGFDPDMDEDTASAHFGLTFMRERMTQVGGRLIIDSQPGTGTCVNLSVPLDAKQKVQI